MPRTPIPEHLIHNPDEVAENSRYFDEIADFVPSWFATKRMFFATHWLETVRQYSENTKQLRLDQYMLPPGALSKHSWHWSKRMLKKFAKKLSKQIDKRNEFALPFRMVVKKDNLGYFISRR